jgi:hypothetical protein
MRQSTAFAAGRFTRRASHDLELVESNVDAHLPGDERRFARCLIDRRDRALPAVARAHRRADLDQWRRLGLLAGRFLGTNERTESRVKPACRLTEMRLRQTRPR